MASNCYCLPPVGAPHTWKSAEAIAPAPHLWLQRNNTAKAGVDDDHVNALCVWAEVNASDSP
jgi:lipopolysaccharide biosynthesis protein